MKNLFEKINSAIKVLAQLGIISKRFNAFAFVVVLLLMSGVVKGQFAGTTVTMSGTAIGGSPYSSLAAAITAVNGLTVTGPVVVTCGTGTEAVPAAGYVITAQGTSTNTIIIQGNGAANSIITGGSGVSTTTFFDAFFVLRGADWITIQGFAMTQSASTAALEREIGVALLHASVTNGAQNNTIQNNTITLNKTNLNTWGIYSNNNHSATTNWTTTESVTNNTTGPASGNKVYNNIITNVNMGIAFIGTATTANQDIGNDIGGSAAGTGNTITNWGGAAALYNPIGNSGSSYCIFLNHQVGENVSFNSLTSATISGTTVSLRGIFKDYSTAATLVGTTNITNNTITITDNFISGTLECIRTQGTVANTSTLNINNNTILNTTVGGASSSTTIVGIVNSEAVGTLSISNNIIRGCTSTATSGGFTGVSNTGSVVTSITMNNNAIGDASGNAITFSAATSGAVLGVNCSGGASTCATSVQTNDIRGIVHSVTGTSAMTLILVSGSPLTLNLSNNTLTNLTLNATGTTRLISYSYTAAANGTKTVNNNSIVTQLTRATSTGEFEALYDYGSTNSGSTITVTNNNFSNLTLPGASTTFYGFNMNDGGTGATHIVTGNTLSNWSTGSTSIIAMIYAPYFGTGTNSVSNNTISNITGTGSIVGILAGASGTAPTLLTISSNTITGLVSSGTGGAVTGLATSNTSASINIYKNKISDLSTTATTSLVAGLTISGSGTNLNVYNNLIGNLTAPASNNTSNDAVRGINITSTSATSSINLFYNTIYLAGTSSATDFASSGIFHTSSATATIASLLLKNNIIANTCTAKGVGKTSALRRSAADLANFSTSSSNNLYYGSTLYFDFTNSDVTMAAFSTRVGARATASFSENPTWVSTTGSNANFLHIDATAPTQIESGGTPISTPISITDDYDADTRNVTTPDVGADEGTFTVAVPMSYTSSTTEQVTGLAYAGATNQSIIRVQIVTTGATSPLSLTNLTLNANGTTAIADINAATAKVYYTGASTTFGTSSLFGATTPTVANFTVTGSQTLVEGNNYFWLAYDVASAATSANLIDGECIDLTVGTLQTPTVSAPSGNKSILGAMSGTYAVGASQTENGSAFTKLTTAIADLNIRGVSGAVTFALQSDYTSASETFPLTINAITGASGTNTITIKPAATVTATISGSSSSSIFKLNGADYVIIDGSNNGSTSRNLTISNSSTSTSSGILWIASATLSDGATNNTVKNCIITGNASTTTLMGVFMGGTSSISTSTSALIDNATNTIQNNQISLIQYGVFVRDVSPTSLGTGLTIAQNNIGTSVNAIGITGIVVHYQDAAMISQNEIQNQSTTSTSNSGGIILLDNKNSTITRNKIYNLNYSGSSIGKIVGIHTSTTTYNTSGSASSLNITNNIIYNLNSTATSSSWNTSGISNNGGYGDKYYFNTVHLTGTLSGSTGGSACFANGNGVITTNADAIDVRNNIFSMQGSSTAAAPLYAHYTTRTSYSGSTLNYNSLYATAGGSATVHVGRFNATNYTAFANWQGAFSQEANSIGSNPNLNSSTNLIPQPGSPVLGAGTAIGGITIDYLGTTRNNPPTIGAYETAVDEAAPVITYTALNSTCLTTNITLTATITDASGVPTAGVLMPRIYYKKDAGGAWFSSQGVLSSGTATNGTWTFTIVAADMGGVANPNVISYYVIAQDVAAISNIKSNPSAGLVATDVNTVSTAPTTPNTYTIQNILAAGTYTVGANQTYTTLTEAITAYNTSCLGGAIVFSLMDASYAAGPGETFPITINANADASATNTLTIKPASGVTATISGSAASSALIKIASKYVTIDGSNTAGGTTRDLTITNTSNTTPNVILIGNSGTSTETALTNVTLKNTILINGVNTATAVIVANNLAAAGYFNNITIQNNSVQKAYVGIYALATAATGNGSGLLITGNDLNTSGANAITYTGIYVQGVDGATVSNNNIGNITSSTANPIGIWFASATNSGSISGNTISALSYTGTDDDNAPSGIISTATTATNILIYNNIISNISSSAAAINYSPIPSGIYISSINTSVYNNKISNIKQTNTGGEPAFGINLSSASTTSGISVYNNFIFDIAGYGWSSIYYNGHGIGLLSGGGYNLYNNTINMNTNQTTGVTSAIYIYSSLVTAGSVNIRNNIFANTQTGGATAANRYAIYCAAANTIFGTINHNNYYTSGTHLGYRGGNRTTLADVVTGFGGNANSLNLAPTFTSATDLHLTSANAALKAGTYISSVLTDYDGDTRNVLTPTMGADEMVFVANLWRGTLSTAFATAGNWDDNAVPSSGANITIPTGVTNKPVLASDKTIGTLELGSGTTLSIGSNTLTINGAVSGTGTLTGSSTSNLTIAGAATTLNFTSGSRSLNNLSLGASGAATLGTALDIYGTIGFTAGGSLNMNAKAVALKSTASATASIGDLTGSTLSGATNLTVERYIPALRKFRFLASPVVGATAANWRNNGVNTAGIGTHITGNINGGINFDPSTTNAASAFSYNELLAGSDVTVGSGATSDPGWTAFTDGNTQALTNGKGFRILVRGDRTISLDGTGSVTPTNTTLSVTGTYPANSVSIATTKTNSNTNSGFNLVGNPYPATIDWNAVTKGTDISATYTTFNPTSNSYVEWNGSTGSATQYISSGQAFFVQQQSGTTSSITIDESDKVSLAGGNFFRNKLSDHLKVSMTYDSANYDAAFIHFREDAQNDFDTYDGLKFQNAGVNIASVGTDGKRYNINSLASLNQTTEIPLSVLGSVLTNFELKFDDVQTFKNHELYLIDHYLNKMLLLSDGFTYPIELSSDSASVKDGRFKIVFVQKATGINTNEKNANAFILYPNPAANSIHLLLDAKNTNNENVSFEIFNQLGARLQQGNLDFTSLKDQTIAIDQLAQGSYFIKLQSKSIHQTIKFIK